MPPRFRKFGAPLSYISVMARDAGEALKDNNKIPR